MIELVEDPEGTYDYYILVSNDVHYYLQGCLIGMIQEMEIQLYA